MKTVLLMIGTRKGAFLATSGVDRKAWNLSGPFLQGSEVHYVTWLPKTDTLGATVKSWWFGSGVRLWKDRGESGTSSP